MKRENEEEQGEGNAQRGKLGGAKDTGVRRACAGTPSNQYLLTALLVEETCTFFVSKLYLAPLAWRV